MTDRLAGKDEIQEAMRRSYSRGAAFVICAALALLFGWTSSLFIGDDSAGPAVAFALLSVFFVCVLCAVAHTQWRGLQEWED